MKCTVIGTVPSRTHPRDSLSLHKNTDGTRVVDYTLKDNNTAKCRFHGEPGDLDVYISQELLTTRCEGEESYLFFLSIAQTARRLLKAIAIQLQATEDSLLLPSQRHCSCTLT